MNGAPNFDLLVEIRRCPGTRQKVPFQLVLGDREVEAREVNVRVRGQEKAEGSVPVDAFVERVRKLIETKAATL